MSPRGFKIGLALFLAMSGVFAAKLTLGAAGLRMPWRGTAVAASAPAANPAPSAPARTPPPVPPKSVTPPPEEVAAVKAETAAHSAPPASESDHALVSAIKLELKTRGYAVGADATTLDLEARAGIIAFEADNDMRLTGEASQDLLHRLLLGDTGTVPNADAPPGPRAETVIRSVQTSLQRAGHPDVKADGQMTRETQETIRAFERAHHMKVTGRVSGDLVAQLRHVARDGGAVAGN